jgi:hypothetical protein
VIARSSDRSSCGCGSSGSTERARHCDCYDDAGADTLLFVLDDERDPDVISRLATAVLSR